MSIDTKQLSSVLGKPVYGSDGEKIGKVGQVFLDDVTGKPEWVTVQTGMFGNKESFVPVGQSEFAEDGLTVPFDKDIVKDAPQVDADQGHLSQEEEADLYRHYGMDYSEEYSDSGLPNGQANGDRADIRDGNGHGTVGHDTSGPTTDEAMTRSEERLDVGTRTRESGKARLRKYVVTQQETVTVPVTREEVRLEREPITDANRGQAMAGPDISEEEHEVTLHEEQVAVNKEAVPVERIKLAKDTVTEDQQVTEQVRKEQFETDGIHPSSGGENAQP
jgi:uncharacterized protein (TIGR02271 family)